MLALLCLTVSSAWAETKTVTFTNSDFAGLSITKNGVTLSAAKKMDQVRIEGSVTFTNSLGGNFTKIVVTDASVDISGDGWSGNTWTGNAESVSFDGVITNLGGFTIVCTIETGSASTTEPTGPTEPIVVASDETIDGIVYTLNGSNYTATVGSNTTYSGGTLVIPETVEYNSKTYTVTSIGSYAFNGCSNLTSVTIPSSVKSFGSYVFYNCSNLSSITLNSNPIFTNDNNWGACTFYNNAAVTMNLPANKVGDDYWTTFYNQYYRFQADENTQVFKVELNGTELTMHEVTDKIVDANTAVVLKSTGTPVMTLKRTGNSTNLDANSLEGVKSIAGITTTTNGPNNYYVLNKTAKNGVGFYKLSDGGTIGANKAYLTYSGDASARSFFLFDEATGIEQMEAEAGDGDGDGKVYDLQGREVENPAPGIYIVNGKKVFIK